MTVPVTIVDYGVGNLLSVCAALDHCGADCTMASEPAGVIGAERLLLPGVGAFGDAMADMREKSLVGPVRAFATSGRPLLGICVGMQMLMDESEEFGRYEGLGLIPGTVKAIPPTAANGAPHPVPHVGWSALACPRPNTWRGTLLADTPEGAWVYFVHSFTAVPADPNHRLADCTYGGRQISAVTARDNVMGCQFHPEKSGEVGLAIIRRFLEL